MEDMEGGNQEMKSGKEEGERMQKAKRTRSSSYQLRSNSQPC